MDYLIALILGIIQGLTEFLPVSSSGHLELAKFILDDKSLGEQSLLMTIVLHFGTAVATLLYFRSDIYEILKNAFSKEKSSLPFILKIIISMIPAALIGVLFNDIIESFFSQNILLVCGMLIVTGLLLFLADKANTTSKDVSYVQSIIIGLSQAVAIIPGISRSGATIATSTILGIDREKAARFSFLMVVPLIIGKIFKDAIDGDFYSNEVNMIALIVGFTAALVTGFLACGWMIKLVKKAKLSYFAYYCFMVGIIGIIYSYA